MSLLGHLLVERLKLTEFGLQLCGTLNIFELDVVQLGPEFDNSILQGFNESPELLLALTIELLCAVFEHLSGEQLDLVVEKLTALFQALLSLALNLMCCPGLRFELCPQGLLL